MIRSFGLDTVVEVIDVNDQVLARSDNSFAETTDPSQLVNNLGPGAVLPLFQLGTGSVESPNSLDAGMRVVLDGTGKDNTYLCASSQRKWSVVGSISLVNSAARDGRDRRFDDPAC